jgi:predicted ArsR family transcriptional regulator
MADDRTLDIFAPRKHARAEGPATSMAAAESMRFKAGSLCTRIYECLRDHGPATQTTLAKRLDMDRQAVNKRLSDLRDAKMIEPSGETQPGPSGRPQTIWRARQ